MNRLVHPVPSQTIKVLAPAASVSVALPSINSAASGSIVLGPALVFLTLNKKPWPAVAAGSNVSVIGVAVVLITLFWYTLVTFVFTAMSTTLEPKTLAAAPVMLSIWSTNTSVLSSSTSL